MILKLKLTPGIFLVGFMGCGKSTVGRVLSDELGWSFFDLDHEIEKRTGEAISTIFDQRGEPAFRTLETEALAERVANVRTGRPQVIALGGGTFTVPGNLDLATNHGVTIWLDTPLQVIEERIAQEDHRPLARDPEKLRALYDIRRDAYARADYRILTESQEPGEVVAQILALPLFVP
jgi:shikimate kinase